MFEYEIAYGKTVLGLQESLNKYAGKGYRMIPPVITNSEVAYAVMEREKPAPKPATGEVWYDPYLASKRTVKDVLPSRFVSGKVEVTFKDGGRVDVWEMSNWKRVEG